MQVLFRRAAVTTMILCAAAIHGVSAAEPDDMMKALLRPAGWSAEWAGPGGAGLTEVVFEQRGDSLVARMKLVLPFEMLCEKPVIVDGRRLTFDGCRDPSVSLVYDPYDPAYPLRGGSPRGYEWKVRPR